MMIHSNAQDFQTAPQKPGVTQTRLLHEFVAASWDNDAKPAMENSGTPVSFRDLKARSGQIANFLIAHGIQSGNIVAIRQNWSVDLFASILGILEAGAAYVVIDPALTVAKADEKIKKSTARLVLGTTSLPALPEIDEVRTLEIDAVPDSLKALTAPVSFAGRRRPVPSRSSSLVCNPGSDNASIKHNDAVRLSKSIAKLYSVNENSRCYHDASVAFDIAVEEALSMISSGATLVLDRSGVDGSHDLAEFVEKQRITHLSATPDIMAEIDEDCPTLEVLILGGKKSPAGLVAKWAIRTGLVVSIKHSGDRFPSYRMEQESRTASRPCLIFARTANRYAHG